MSRYYDVDIFKTFYKSMTVEAESDEEARIIAFALNDNFEFDDELEFCDDENRLDVQIFPAPPTAKVNTDVVTVFSKENIDVDEYEYAKKSLAEHDRFWEDRNETIKRLGIKEYLEKQGK